MRKEEDYSRSGWEAGGSDLLRTGEGGDGMTSPNFQRRDLSNGVRKFFKGGTGLTLNFWKVALWFFQDHLGKRKKTSWELLTPAFR